ncbi:MAG: hypothetical protein IT385_24480 [Deltaproteobacteria bacterium]|nr:hypothetical protein [Deltaproteobacteria bacterium]
MDTRKNLLPLRALALATLAGIAGCGDDNSGTRADTVNVPDDTVTAATDSSSASETSTPDDTQAPPDGDAGCALGQACDDGDPCTIDDACDAQGACAGAPKCDDGLACTTDSCAEGTCTNALLSTFCLGGADQDVCVATGGKDPANTCRSCALGTAAAEWVTLGDGAFCTDGTVCTTGDKCQAGVCVGGTALQCPTTTPCVARSCDAQLGCVDANTTAACDDKDPCTVGDTCGGGACQAGTAALDCDDDNPCTVDSCQEGVGCFHDAFAKCDDDKPCTADSCNVANGECTNTTIEAGGLCDDGDPCTSGETCNASSQCLGGQATVCDDANPCTLDTCVSNAGGCLNLFLDQACDDGESCTTNDQCVAGLCFGGKTAACDFCTVEPTDDANKIVSLEVMSDGNPGSGLDLDDDPGTCAPEGNCAGGVDNALSVLAGIMNPGVSDSIEGGVVKWIVDLRDAKLDGSAFAFKVYDSGLAPDSAGCDYQTATCSYDIAQLSFGPDCEPYFILRNAKVEGDTLTAGGTGDLINMVLPLANGSLLGVTIAVARAEATITTDGQGNITGMNGIIAGAIPKSQLMQAVQELDPDALPIDKEDALQLLDLIVTNDIDLDGDGLDEAASVGMRIRTIPAIIWGSE